MSFAFFHPIYTIFIYWSNGQPCWFPDSWAKPKPLLKRPDCNLLKNEIARGNTNLEKNATNITCACDVDVGLNYDCKDYIRQFNIKMGTADTALAMIS